MTEEEEEMLEGVKEKERKELLPRRLLPLPLLGLFALVLATTAGAGCQDPLHKVFGPPGH